MDRHTKLFFILILIASPFVCANEPEHVVAVAPAVFHESLKPWIEYRASQGYVVHVVAEPFGENATTPERVKERIRAFAEQVPLSAVLLVGNGVARTPSERNRVIPSPRFASKIVKDFGPEDHLSSDNWYSDLDGDGSPDLAIGRFPVGTPEELDEMIQKTILYETQTDCGLWDRRLQLVAGVGLHAPLVDGMIDSTFRYVLSETIPTAWDVRILQANWRSPFCPDPRKFQAELVESINRAPRFWAYLGHGNHRMLDPVTTPKGLAPTLDGRKEFPVFRCEKNLPVVFLFCCYGGTLDASTRSLAEEMILQPQGPAAVLASSRTTMPYGMSVLGIEVLREMLRVEKEKADLPESERFLTLGEIIRDGKRRSLLPVSPNPETSKAKSFREMRQRPLRENLEIIAKMLDPKPTKLDEQLLEHLALFHLFGDPLLRITTPGTVQLVCPAKVKAGETLRVEGALSDRFSTPAFPDKISVELIHSPDRLSLTSPTRNEFLLDEKTLEQYDEEYVRSNNIVLLRGETSISSGKYSVSIPIPKDFRGHYIVRVFCATKKAFGFNSAAIVIEKN